MSESPKGNVSDKTRKYAYLAIFGGLEGFLSIIIAAFIFFSGKEFNIYLFWVSNLGVTSNKSLSGYIFNIGLFISAFLLLISIYLLEGVISEKTDEYRIARFIAKISSVLCSIGIVLLSLFNMETNSLLHAIGAYNFFVNSVIFTGIYTYILQSMGIGRKIQKIVMYLLGFVCVEYIFSSILNSFMLEPEIDQSLSSMSPALSTLRFMEWQLVSCFFFWLFATGYSMYKVSKSDVMAINAEKNRVEKESESVCAEEVVQNEGFSSERGPNSGSKSTRSQNGPLGDLKNKQSAAR